MPRSLPRLLRSHDLDLANGHELTSERDLITLLEADFGVAFAPRSIAFPETLKQAPVDGVELDRSVYLYGVAGRERTRGGVRGPQDAARGRLVALRELGLKVSSAAPSARPRSPCGLR